MGPPALPPPLLHAWSCQPCAEPAQRASHDTGLPCREELQQPVFAAIDSLEYPELHDESIPVIAFVTHVTKLLNASGIKDFSLRVS